MRILLLFSLLCFVNACGEGVAITPEPEKCSSANCSGCCKDNICIEKASNKECGIGGSICQDCERIGQICNITTFNCQSDCIPKCNGKCAGADDKCGSTCPANTCLGCCNGIECKSGLELEACGKQGGQCSDCSLSTDSTCVEGNCSNCKADCEGKCEGAADGCGNKCPASDCEGCCDGLVCKAGTENDACGKSGVACADCTTTDSVCESASGTCNNCQPDCTNKCSGASDGCGGTCLTTTCNGCCSSTTCLAGTDNNACGKNGEKCWVCPSDYQNYSWICDAQVCVKDQPIATACTGKADGDACTENSLSGKCYNQLCCTGCWDQQNSSCNTATSNSDTSCGQNGELCIDCTASSEICDNHSCQSSTLCGGVQCKFYETCQSDSCVVDTSAKIKVIAVSAEFEDQGTLWDNVSFVEYQKPDPVVCFRFSCGTTAFCSPAVEDTFAPLWNDATLMSYSDLVIANDHCVDFRDEDPSSYNEMGSCTFKISANDISSGVQIISGPCHTTSGLSYIKTFKIQYQKP